MLATGNFGKFNIQNIIDKYVKEQINYSLKTCESSPSYDCLAFISLDNGIKKCERSGSFSGFLSASNNFKNAYSIFKSQKNFSDKDLVVLSAYRKCANLSESDFGKDFINSRLVNLLFFNGDESKAIGLIQNMKTPLFKVLAAADLRVNQGKYDHPTYEKLIDKAKNFDSRLDRESAILTLTNKLYDVGIGSSRRIDANRLLDSSSRSGIAQNCKDEKTKYISELAMDLLFNKKASYGGLYTDHIQRRAELCGNYKIRPILYFLGENDIDTALSIRNHQSSRGTDADLLVDHLREIVEPEDLFRMYMVTRGAYPYNELYGKNEIFKTMIDIEEVCKASEILFTELRGSKYETKAVSHFISSPTISSEKKYVCGDEDLDLLIN